MQFDAVAFLEALYRQPVGGESGPRPRIVPMHPTGPDDLPADWHFLWDERAAIREYDGGLPREQAEALALADILEQMQTRQKTAADD